MAVKVTLLLKKLDTLTDEDFHEYWAGPHAQIFLGVPIVKEKVLRFSQFHIDKSTSTALAAQGLPIAEYDGEVKLWFASVEDFMAMFSDPEYQRLVWPDAEVFSKTKDSKLMIGYDKDFVL